LEAFIDDRLPGARTAGRVHLLGPVPHSSLPALRRQSAVSVACSRYENFPGTVLEAAAMGCPTVAARVGGIPESTRDGGEGLPHRAGAPDVLGARIIAMLSDPGRAAEFGRLAAARCDQEFDPIVIAERMVAHFRRTRAQFAARVRAG